MIISSGYLFAQQITSGDMPILPPDYWINDYHIDHFHDIKSPTSRNSRPCSNGQTGDYFQIRTVISDIQSVADCGVTGAKEIPIFYDETSLDIPLYRNGELLNNKLVFRRYNDDPAEGYWRPKVDVIIYKNGVPYRTESCITNVQESQIEKVYLYAGVDTVSLWKNNTMSSMNGYLFCGVAVFYLENGYLYLNHACVCYKLSYIDYQAGSLGADWYTIP